MVTNIPLFGTWGTLNFDIDIDSYTITPFYFFFYLFYTTGISADEETEVEPSPLSSGGYQQIRWNVLSPSFISYGFCFPCPWGPREIVIYTGGNAVHF